MGNHHSQASRDTDLQSLDEKVLKDTETGITITNLGSVEDEELYYTAEEDSICSLTPERTRPESSSAESLSSESSFDSSCESIYSDNDVCSVASSSGSEFLVTSSFLHDEDLTSSSVSDQNVTSNSVCKLDSSSVFVSDECTPSSSFSEQNIPQSSAKQKKIVLSADTTLSSNKTAKTKSNKIFKQCAKVNNSKNNQVYNSRNKSNKSSVTSTKALCSDVDKVFNDTNISQKSGGRKRKLKNLSQHIHSQSKNKLNIGKTTSQNKKHSVMPNGTASMFSELLEPECSAPLKRFCTGTNLNQNSSGHIDSSESDSDEKLTSKKRKLEKRNKMPVNQKRRRRFYRYSRRDSS